jgi:hypothetical protein
MSPSSYSPTHRAARRRGDHLQYRGARGSTKISQSMRRAKALRLLCTRAHAAGRLGGVDAKATSENKVQIMVPKGQSFATAEPLIYVQVFYQPDKQQALADFARLSNARWLAANPKAKITELPAVERANGKPAFLRFTFENPGKARQAYEVGALGADSDKDGNDFVLDVVMTGNSKAALDRADAAYTAFLKTH